MLGQQAGRVHDVRVFGRDPVAPTVPDQDHPTASGMEVGDGVQLAGGAVGAAIATARRPGRDQPQAWPVGRQVGTADDGLDAGPGEHPRDVEAEAVAGDLDDPARGPGGLHQGSGRRIKLVGEGELEQPVEVLGEVGQQSFIHPPRSGAGGAQGHQLLPPAVAAEGPEYLGRDIHRAEGPVEVEEDSRWGGEGGRRRASASRVHGRIMPPNPHRRRLRGARAGACAAVLLGGDHRG